MKTLVIALGGNAIQASNSENTFEDHQRNIQETVHGLIPILKNPEHAVVMTHGNGPQVGSLLIQQAGGQDTIPEQPMFICGAMTQGQIGYLLQQEITNQLSNSDSKREAATVVTQVLVDNKDDAFKNPLKPVGPFYKESEISTLKTQNPGFSYIEDSGRGWRRVVPSPMPIEIIEQEAIDLAISKGHIVIGCGGGGIPVIREDNHLMGVDAVIDKDRASALLANNLNADIFIVLTAVEQVFINFGKSNQKPIDELDLKTAKKYITDGHFAPGSMLPKIEAIIEFVEGKKERKALITDSKSIQAALNGDAGTWIVN